MAIFFYLFAFLLILSSIQVISSRNSVYAVLWLIFTFCNAAGLMVLLGAEFIAMMLVIIYVGAIAVLFLFVVMMIDPDKSMVPVEQLKAAVKNNRFIAILIISALSVNLLLVIYTTGNNLQLESIEPIAISTDSQVIKSNTHQIGQILYTDFFLPFQLAGLILFVAIVVSISLTLQDGISRRKRQDKVKQQSRSKDNTISVVRVQNAVGVQDIKYD